MYKEDFTGRQGGHEHSNIQWSILFKDSSEFKQNVAFNKRYVSSHLRGIIMYFEDITDENRMSLIGFVNDRDHGITFDRFTCTV